MTNTNEQIDDVIQCPICKHPACYNSHTDQYVCMNVDCSWTSEQIYRFKGNYLLLDDFINKLESRMSRNPILRCSKQELKQAAIRLFNSMY